MTTLPPTSDGEESTSPRKHPEAKCEDCPLFHDEEAAYAGGTGPGSAAIVILGEAPGYNEARKGKAFVGTSGKLLDAVLADKGLQRADVYVDNVVACRPPDNRTPSKQEIKCCWPRAAYETRARTPRKILALGNTAAQAVLETGEGITALRAGPPKASKQFPGVEVVPTFHPAAALRNGDVFPDIVTDVGKLAQEVHVPFEEPNYVIYDDEEAILALEELNRDYRRIVVDIEAGIEKDTEYDHPDHYQMLCIGFAYAPGKAVIIGEKACANRGVQVALRELLENPDKEWVAQNGKFDLAGLYQYGRAHLYFDTMLAHYALDERRGTHGLKYLAGEFLGAPPYDDEVKKYVGKDDTYAVVPREVLYKYNAYDVVCTWGLMELFEARLEEEGLRPVHDFLVEASDALMLTEMEGIAIDEAWSEKLMTEYLGILEGLEDKLSPWVKNPRSPKQVMEALVDLGMHLPDTTKDTLEHQLEVLDPLDEQAEFISLMLEHRKEAKAYGTYVKGIRKRTRKGRIHSSFLLHGTTTGRLSSRNPNLQNIPRSSTPQGKALRDQFVPEEGNVFVQADYGQIELRIAALLSEDDYLMGVFNDPERDMFDELGVRLYGPAALGPDRKNFRIRTKAYAYGVGYGREAYSIANEFRIPVSEAQRGLNDYLGQVPKLVRWRDEIRRNVLEEQDDLVTPLGRHRRFWLITRENVKDVIKEAYAFIPQSTASDVNLTAYIRLREMGLATRVPVHDSILVECAREEAEDVGQLMEKVMIDTAYELLGNKVMFTADYEIGDRWGEV